MTKEERAIKVLINVQSQFQASLDEVDVDKDCREAEEDNAEVVNALEMAIKLLKERPRKDTISRADMLDAVGHGTTYTSEEVQNIVNSLPPAAPKPKIGHWINGDPICPCCGEDKFKDLDADIWSDWQPKHCPNCGAKMFEPQESEDRNESTERN